MGRLVFRDIGMDGKWRVKEGSVNGRAIGGLVGCKLGVEWSFGVVFERFLFLNGRCCGIAAISETCCSLICFSFNFTKRKAILD